MRKVITDPIHEWAKAGNLSALQGYVEENSTDDLNDLNDFEETPLMIALKYRQQPVVNFLLKRSSVDVHQQCPAYATPLVAAVYFENIDAVKRLIELEKAIKGRFDPKKHPGLLLTAIRRDNAELVECLLLEEGVDINDPGSDNYNEEQLYDFDRAYADPTPFDFQGPPVFELPVIVAIQERKVNALRALLKHEPDIDKIGNLNYNAKQLIEGSGRSTYEQARGKVDQITTNSLSSSSLFGQKANQPSLHTLLNQLCLPSTPVSEKVAVVDDCRNRGLQIVKALISGNAETSETEQLQELLNALSKALKEQLCLHNNSATEDWGVPIEITPVEFSQ